MIDLWAIHVTKKNYSYYLDTLKLCFFPEIDDIEREKEMSQFIAKWSETPFIVSMYEKLSTAGFLTVGLEGMVLFCNNLEDPI